MSRLPTFESPFLEHVCRMLDDRSKALRHHGKLEWETKQPDDFEWLTVNFTPLVGNYCVFQFAEDNRVCVFVRSKRRANRGQVLLTMNDFNVVDNARGIVGAMETTIVESGNLESSQRTNAFTCIAAAWDKVKVQLSGELDK